MRHLIIILFILFNNFIYNQNANSISHKILTIHDIEQMTELAKNNTLIKNQLHSYLVGLQDGIVWTSDLVKKQNNDKSTGLFCMKKNKTISTHEFISIVREYIKKNKNITIESKKIFPYSLAATRAIQMKYSCK